MGKRFRHGRWLAPLERRIAGRRRERHRTIRRRGEHVRRIAAAEAVLRAFFGDRPWFPVRLRVGDRMYTYGRQGPHVPLVDLTDPAAPKAVEEPERAGRRGEKDSEPLDLPPGDYTCRTADGKSFVLLLPGGGRMVRDPGSHEEIGF